MPKETKLQRIKSSLVKLRGIRELESNDVVRTDLYYIIKTLEDLKEQIIMNERIEKTLSAIDDMFHQPLLNCSPDA